METLTNKEKIILVLKESIKFGKQTNFVYDIMLEKHKEVLFIKNFKETIEQKIKLLENLDENSYTFKRILDTAGIACRKLQDDECYNFYSAELIMKINQLERCFNKKLKSIGIRIVEEKQKVEIINDVEKIIIEDDEDEELIPLTADCEYVEPRVTGKKLHSKIKKQKEISSALQENSFNENE